MNTCGLLRYSVYGTRDAAQNREVELATALSNIKIDERKRVLVRVEVTSRERTLLQPWVEMTTIVGERSAVDFLITMISKKYEIKKQVIAEDPDLEKSGRILNRVIEWNRDGITIEARDTSGRF